MRAAGKFFDQVVKVKQKLTFLAKFQNNAICSPKIGFFLEKAGKYKNLNIPFGVSPHSLVG